jgi:hypothetical protein
MSRLQNKANAEALQGSMSQNNGGVRLPFAVPFLWWKNASTELADTEEILDVRRFGGWGISKDDIDDQKDQLPPELPANWKLFENLRNHDGGTYAAYLARTVWAAPIDRRFVWKTYEGKSRSKVNILCYAATLGTDRKLLPWGPVVLSGSSYSGKAIDDAIASFKQGTDKLRDGDPVNLFYIPLGTFGADPAFDKFTGKDGKSSSTTPCQTFVPDGGYTAQTLDDWFVGDNVAAEMGLLRAQSTEWLDEWNKKKEEVKADELPPMPEDDFPY